MRDFISLNGLTFGVQVLRDEGMGEPWKEHDGHGAVSDWETRGKRAGERVLITSRDERLYYDVRATLEIARRDGWGLSDAELERAFDRADGHKPTPREITAWAVDADFERLRRWCEGDWHWCGVVVTLLDTDGDDTDECASLWGIESDAGAYLDVVARELAEQIAERVGDATELTHVTRIRA